MSDASDRGQLPDPLAPLLVDAADEEAVQRMWTGVQARRARPPAKMRTTWRWVAAAGLAAAAATAAVLWVGGPDAAAPGALVRADGSALPRALVAGSDGARWPLADESWITLAPGTRLEVLASEPTSFTTLLSRGRVRFDVRPGGPRRWVVECGLASVEVVGTSFTVERDESSVRVAVHHGAVLVRSDDIVDNVRRLAAGESIVLRARTLATSPAPSAAPAAATVDSPATAPPAPEPTSSARTGSEARGTAPWRRAAARQDFRAAYAQLGSEGIAATTRTAGVRDLLTLADVARLGGHPEDAVAPLERIVTEFPSDRQAPVAAFTLGRIHLDALGDPVRAASAFERAIALGLPAALREDAQARRVEAWARAGRRDEAAAAAAAYFAAFPDGRHRRAVERWVGR